MKQISTYQVPYQREDTNKLCILYGVVSQIVNLKQEAVNGLTERYYAQIRIGTKVVEFEVDSGAAYSFLPHNVYAGLNLGVTMHQTDISIPSYTHNVFVPDGKINIKEEFNGTVINDQIYIVPETHNAIAGHVRILKFGLYLRNLDTHAADVSTVKLIDNIENMDQGAQIYPVPRNGKIGKIPDVVVSHKLRKGAQPVFHRQRDVPYALIKKVDAELDTLEAEGVLI
ncbi:hypothetical protein PR048_009026 [Dryococelus australis]|uniref:Uncharacterized protein n=1 Tax=Dryococelus australis TaxID=614101 RepID=A0ABQ9HYR1_9NEOP|nr:hypothetical protein PR048_009026 [Dryococelus australis]